MYAIAVVNEALRFSMPSRSFNIPEFPRVSDTYAAYGPGKPPSASIQNAVSSTMRGLCSFSYAYSAFPFAIILTSELRNSGQSSEI